MNVFQVKEGERVREQNSGESRYKEFCKNSVLSGEKREKLEDRRQMGEWKGFDYSGKY